MPLKKRLIKSGLLKPQCMNNIVLKIHSSGMLRHDEWSVFTDVSKDIQQERRKDLEYCNVALACDDVTMLSVILLFNLRINSFFKL